MTFRTSNVLSVTVLMGGTSCEREISLDSGRAVVEALREAGHVVTACDLVKDELPAVALDQIIFPVLHGPFGEDGRLQKLLEDANFSFVGCGSRCSELLMDKVETGVVANQYSILMPKTEVINSVTTPFPAGWEFPVIVKPAKQGSSFGLSLVRSLAEWEPALELALRTDSTAVVQEYIDGVEIAVGVVDGVALPVVEIIPAGDIFDFDAKYVYSAGKTVYNCPPKLLGEESQLLAQQLATSCFSQFGCRDVCRMDFMVRDDELFFIEGNTIPGFTANSLLPKSAAVAGLSFPELCDRLVQSAFLRKNNMSVEHKKV
jgi:D-alanine-D-alanine ligase